MRYAFILLLLCGFVNLSCQPTIKSEPIAQAPFIWENANMYFLLTDRFYNGDSSNDLHFDRTKETAVLRGFEGGDFTGITQKIKEGYFSDLGINALWFSPILEQIHGATNEGTGNTYGFHGYWTKDWTAIEPNFGSREEFKELVDTAHKKGIRIVLDVVLNHTGPVTEQDQVWPSDWVRTTPACTYDSYENTTACTLVKNLPDILTENKEEVILPEFLKEKWAHEGRLNTELAELETYFQRTGYQRTPQAYIVKWLTDYVAEYGIDGFRVDTVKHASEAAWDMLYKEASYAFNDWKTSHPNEVLDTNSFYMMGEVYNYGISGGRAYDFGDKKVDYYAHGFHSLINFELKYDADKSYSDIFNKYDRLLQGPLKSKSVLNYLTSHDDGQPYDKFREKSFRAANVLFLTPGGTQLYYGDETNRDLDIPGTEGDATLRSFMNWEQLDNNEVQTVLEHYQKLGQFKGNHPAIGAGKHKDLSQSPYTFSRTYTKNDYRDQVVVALDAPMGIKGISVAGVFEDGTVLTDAYSGGSTVVKSGKASIDSPYGIVLLSRK